MMKRCPNIEYAHNATVAISCINNADEEFTSEYLAGQFAFRQALYCNLEHLDEKGLIYWIDDIEFAGGKFDKAAALEVAKAFASEYMSNNETFA